MKNLFGVGLVLLGCRCLSAADLYVNQDVGTDRHDGLSARIESATRGPLKTIQRAVDLAGAGDTIHLAVIKGDYRQEVQFRDKGGEPGRPITLDGHGATLSGAEPCAPGGWVELEGGVWRRKQTLSRNILIVDGEMILETRLAGDLKEGEFCFETNQWGDATLFFRPPSGRKAAEFTIETVSAAGEVVRLDPTKWSGGSRPSYKFKGKPRPAGIRLDGTEALFPSARASLQPGHWCMEDGDLYFYPVMNKNPATLNVQLVVRGTGVSLTGEKGHVAVKNLNVRYVWNDAFNIHGRVIDAQFFNCNATDCFDEGFSAHDACETVLDGAVFTRCDNGVFNVNTEGGSVTRNLVVRDCRHYGFGVAIVESKAKHVLEDAVLAGNGSQLFGRYLKANNVLILADAARADSTGIVAAAPFQLSQATVSGQGNALRVERGSGEVRLSGVQFKGPADGQRVLLETRGKVMLDAVEWSDGTRVRLPKTNADEGTEIPVTEWSRALSSADASGTLTAAIGCTPELWKLAEKSAP
ncbi:MAG: hypothetical protein K0R17_2463 [Rariglobus sp.]|jgi:hypothetical protein|nr:hypothetical protein [Rariglobus sp.]